MAEDLKEVMKNIDLETKAKLLVGLSPKNELKFMILVDGRWQVTLSGVGVCKFTEPNVQPLGGGYATGSDLNQSILALWDKLTSLDDKHFIAVEEDSHRIKLRWNGYSFARAK